MKPVRPRKTDRHLPPCVYAKHGAYWLVKAGKWTRLGPATDLAAALREYARLASPQRTAMGGLLTRWLESIEGKVKPATLKLYAQSAKRIGDVFAEFDPADIRPRDVARWMAHESTRPAWANRLRTVLKLAMDYAVMMGLADGNPVISIPRAEEPERTRYITDAEFRAIEAHADPLLKVVMGLAYFTGQRISDILAIKLAAITPEGIQFRQIKTGARLLVAWSPDLRRLIDAAKGMGGNVRGMHLLCYNGHAVRYHMIYDRWTAACKAAGVPDAHIHDLRAKALTDADLQGQDAQALGGHTEKRQTDHYVKIRKVPTARAPKFGAKY